MANKNLNHNLYKEWNRNVKKYRIYPDIQDFLSYPERTYGRNKSEKLCIKLKDRKVDSINYYIYMASNIKEYLIECKYPNNSRWP
jgi:hypothetical protein